MSVTHAGGRFRTPAARLAWLDEQLSDLVTEMRGDAEAINRNRREGPEARAVAAELAALAERIEGILGAAVLAPAGPVDHLAEIRWHLDQLSRQARTARAGRRGSAAS